MQSRRSGFSLIQMSVILMIAALLMTAMLPGGGYDTSDSGKAKLTLDRMKKIEKATQDFMTKNQRRPYPADITAAYTSAAFGTELHAPADYSVIPSTHFTSASTSTTADTATGDATLADMLSTAAITKHWMVSGTGIQNYSWVEAITTANDVLEMNQAATALGNDRTLYFRNPIVAGGVPTKTLGIPDEFAIDGYGRRIVYVVDQRATIGGPEVSMTVSGAANSGGLIRLTVDSTAGITTGDQVTVSAVGGTTEANGTWKVTVVNATQLDLIGSSYSNAYTSGGNVLNAPSGCLPLQENHKRGAVALSNSENFATGTYDATMWALLSYGKDGQGGTGIQGGATRLATGNTDASTLVNAFYDGTQTKSFTNLGLVRKPATATFDDIVWVNEPTKNICAMGAGSRSAFDFMVNGGDDTNGAAKPTSAAFGDVNGDGFADMIIGVPDLDVVRVVFGRKGGWPTPPDAYNTSELDGSKGFTIAKGTVSSGFGSRVAAADVNGDGFDDVIAGSSSGGIGYAVVFGGSAWPATYEIGTTTTPTTAITIGGLSTAAVSHVAVGDVNGDGLADISLPFSVSTDNWAQGIIYGKSSAWSNITLGTTFLNGTNGVYFSVASVSEVNGEISYGKESDSVTNRMCAICNVNGDAYKDIIIPGAGGGSGSGGADGGGGSGAVPVIQSVATAVSPANLQPDITINKPSGTTEGDVLVAILTKRSSSNDDFYLPAGWTKYTSSTDPGGDYGRVIIAYRVAGDSEPASYTFDNYNASNMQGSILRISGANNVTPFVTSASSVVGMGTNSNTLTCESVTTTGTNNLILYAAHRMIGQDFLTTPAGTTEAVNILSVSETSAPGRQGVYYKTQASAGATGTGVFTFAGSQYKTCVTLAIQPGEGTVTKPHIQSFSSAGTGNAASEITISAPSGIQEGDVLLAVISRRTSNVLDIPAPSGWTAINSIRNTSNTQFTGIEVFYKVATSSEPASYTFDNVATATLTGVIYRIYGVDTDIAPISDAANAASTNTTNMDCPSVTTTVDGSLVMYAKTAAGNDLVRIVTAPASTMSGVTALSGASTVYSHQTMNYKYLTTAGASGVGSYVSNSNTSHSCVTIAFAPTAPIGSTQRAYVVLGGNAATWSNTYDNAGGAPIDGHIDPSNSSVGKQITFTSSAAVTANYDFKGLACKDINSDGKDDALFYFKNNTANNAAAAIKEFIYGWFGEETPVTQNLDATFDLNFNLTGSAPAWQDVDSIPRIAFADVNWDGKRDIILSRTGDDPYFSITGDSFAVNNTATGTQRLNAGTAFVLYQPNSWGATPGVTKTWFSDYLFDGTNGITLSGAAASDGMVVEDSADMNKDGKDDLLVTSGANPTGAYLMFGKATWPTTYDLNCPRDITGAHCITQIKKK